MNGLLPLSGCPPLIPLPLSLSARLRRDLCPTQAIRLLELHRIKIMEHNDHSIIVATIVPDADRLDFLPRHFGPLMLHVERQVYSWLSTLSADYTGGYWDYVSLSNHGCYMRPVSPDRFRISVHSNDFSDVLSADATGITATLFALSSLAFQMPRFEALSTRFHQLRDFAAQHTERRLIFQAID